MFYMLKVSNLLIIKVFYKCIEIEYDKIVAFVKFY